MVKSSSISFFHLSAGVKKRQTERESYMLLQIDKFLEGKEGALRTDIIDGVKRINHCENFVMVEFNDGRAQSFAGGEIDHSFDIDVSKEFKEYIISQIWLLNDNGKTLRQLI
jgi:hypothetical protein